MARRKLLKKEHVVKTLDELLDEAKKYNKLSDKEVDYVVNKIKTYKPGDADDLYILIYILGQASRIEYRKLVEGFLHYPSDSMISRIALIVLCDYWDYTQDYLKEIKQLLALV